MLKRNKPVLFLAALLFCLASSLAAVVLYQLPPIHQRLAWRIDSLRTKVKYALHPPEQVVFVPQQQGDATARAFPSATVAPTFTQTPLPSATLPGSTSTPQPSLTPTASPTPIPTAVVLEGIVYQPQTFNNCGPANLAMALTYWGWTGDQRDTRAYLRPDERDKNIMPAEMVQFVETQTGLKALARVGGDLDLLRRLIAAGFPPILEKGLQPHDDWWMGHYLVLNGYDDARQRFTAQDSLVMKNFPLPYEDVEPWWDDFNYAYVVVYPGEREAELLALLGPQADPVANFRFAAEKARQDIQRQSGRDLYFAWYNLGSNLVALEDYPAAAEAYDQAFAIYPSISEEDRPYRMLWYQVGPYPAYYYTGRYQDVIDLANTTFNWIGDPVLEETYYWRGMARLAIGDQERGTSDIRKAVQLNPHFTAALEQLQKMGVPLP